MTTNSRKYERMFNKIPLNKFQIRYLLRSKKRKVEKETKNLGSEVLYLLKILLSMTEY